MRQLTRIIGICLALLIVASAVGGDSAVDSGVIRLRAGDAPPTSGPEPEQVQVEVPRRGFDYEAFESRLESLWFQRKTLLANGRVDDATLQLERIRAFCAEEGVKRLEPLSGALVAEAHRYFKKGNAKQALSSLSFAEAFDPGRPQIHLGRSAVYASNRQLLGAAGQVLAAVRGTVIRSLQDLRLFHHLAFVSGLALIASALVFSLLMLIRHNTALRHEVEEWAGQFLSGHWPVAAGWVLLALPFVLWFGAGWAALYWMVLTFRFMSRSERVVTSTLLALGVLVLPAYGVAVGLYGTTADPAVRATLTSAGGEYDPDRIVRLRRLVESYPDDPVYRFLLAGQYKNGRYFEEAFAQYKKVLELDPTRSAAHLNIGNIFFATGQHAEAIANYRRSLNLEPGSFLAHYNMHLAQSEDFRFGEAERSLEQARRIDADRVATLLARSSGWDRPIVQDASLEMASLWEAAVGGRGAVSVAGSSGTDPGAPRAVRLMNPFSIVCSLGLFACLLFGFLGRHSTPARRCIRCGRPFCYRCKSGREAREYCSQCLHLYVLRDGLAPSTKSQKIYEVEQYEARTRRIRGLLSLVLPGSVHVLRGHTARGVPLLLGWCAALVVLGPYLLSLTPSTGSNLTAAVLTGSLVVPSTFEASPFVLPALVALPAIWLAANLWSSRRKES